MAHQPHDQRHLTGTSEHSEQAPRVHLPREPRHRWNIDSGEAWHAPAAASALHCAASMSWHAADWQRWHLRREEVSRFTEGPHLEALPPCGVLASARHSAVSLHVAGVRVALAHRRPLPAVGRLVDAGQVRHKAAARGRGSCPRRRSAAQLAGVSALHVHVRRVGVALAGLSPAFTALGGVGRAAVGLRRRGSDAKALRIVSGVPARGCALSCRHDFVGVAICSTVRSLPPSMKEQCGAAAPQPLREALLFTLADPVGHDDEGKRPSD